LVKIGWQKSWKTFANFENVIEKSFVTWRVHPLVKIKHVFQIYPVYLAENNKTFFGFSANLKSKRN
jgi:hypothetical protein